MNKGEENEVKRLIFEKIMNVHQEEAKQAKVKTFQEKLHLYIDKVFIFLRNPRKGKKKPSPKWLSGEQKQRLKGILEIGTNILGYGIVGGLVLLLLLFLFPSANPISIVKWIKSDVWVQVVMIVLGSGSTIYLGTDLYSFYKEKQSSPKPVDRRLKR